MTSMPPFVAQERPDACAVACLRMVLAQTGIEVTEAELIRKTTLDEGGLTPEELAVLARSCGLDAAEQTLADGELIDLVKQSRYPIVYLFRKLLDGVASVHAVIPVAFSRHFITILDPFARQTARLTQEVCKSTRHGAAMGGRSERAATGIVLPLIFVLPLWEQPSLQ